MRDVSGEVARRKTLEGSVIRLLVIALQGISTLLIIPLSLRYLSRDDYAVSVVIRNVGLYLVLAAEIGLGQTIVNFGGAALARNDQRAFSAVITNGLLLYSALAGLVLGTFLVAAAVLPLQAFLLGGASAAYPQFPALLVGYGCLVLIVVPLNVFPAALLALRQVTRRYALDAIGTVFAFAAATLPLALGYGLRGLVYGSALGAYATSLGAVWIIRRSSRLVRISLKDANAEQIRSEFTNSAFFLVLGIGIIAQRTVGTLVLAQHGFLSDVAVAYALIVVYRLSGWSLLDVASRVAQPFVIYFETVGRHDRVVFYAALGTKLTTSIALVFVLVLAGLGEPVFRIVGLDVRWPEIVLMGAALVVDALFVTSLNVLIAINAHRRLAFVYLVYAAVSFASSSAALSLLPFRPIVSLSIGLLAAAVLAQAALLPGVMSRALAITVTQFVRQFLLRPIFVASVSLAVTGVIHSVGRPFDVLDLPLAAIAAAATWRGVLTHEERAVCLSFWPLLPAAHPQVPRA